MRDISEYEGLSVSRLVEYAWTRGDLRYKLHSTQKEMHESVANTETDEILILSSRQLGKSFFGACYAIEYCLQNPGTIVRIMAATLKQIQDIVQDNLGPITQDAPPGLIERHKTSYRWRVGESSLRLGPLERSNVDYNRGGNASLVITEEGGFVHTDDYRYAIESVIGPQLLRSGGKLMHITSPSQDPAHYIHTEVLPKTAMTKSVFRYSIYDNPQITEEQIEKAKKLCGGDSTAAWRREYLAEIVRDASIVIVPTYDPERHVKAFRVPDYSNWQVCIDFGGSRDKTAALLYTYDFQENKVLIQDERIFEPNTPTDKIVAVVREMESGVLGYGQDLTARWADAPGQLQIDLEKSHGFPIRIPRKDDWQAGINNMQVMFASDQILIHPKCTFLLQSLESGQYNDKRTDFARTQVLGHCDALAALGYALRMIDRRSPFPEMSYSRDRVFTSVEKKTEVQQVAEALQPKVFSNDFSGGFALKRFGTFRKT